MVFWKRNFRNVESFDEESQGVPVKVTYFEGDSFHDMNSARSARTGVSNFSKPSQVRIPTPMPPKGAPPAPVESTNLDETMETFSAVEDDDEQEQPGKIKRKKMYIILACLFIVGVALLISGIIVRKNKRGHESVDKSQEGIAAATLTPTSSPVEGPTVSPTQSPTVSPTELDLVALWIEKFNGLTDSVTFQRLSPQRAAVQWLVAQDDAALDPRTTEIEEATERYIAAVLYYATNGPGWEQKYKFMTKDNVCSWNFGGPGGITCNDSGRVTDLFLVENNLKGTIPSEINYLRNLQNIDLYYNQLRGSIPDLGNLLSLRHIDLGGTGVLGAVPDSLFNLPSIERILLLNNPELSGTIPDITSSPSRLQRISFYNCNLTGKLPSSLGTATDLTFLQFYGNSLTGSVPSGLTKLPNLELLSLKGNQLTGSLPAFGGQSSLETISVGENQLGGKLPGGLGDLPGLVTLYLNDNDFTGVVPSDLNDSQSLQHLWLFGNDLSGPMPTFSGNPGTLEQFYLNDNMFTGTLDGVLSQAPTSIQFMSLGGNPQVTGSLSGSVERFTSLRLFNVSYTGVIGVIPSQISSLDLGILALHATNLSGDLTSIICPDATLPNSLSDLSADCGGTDPVVDCACCTQCCSYGSRGDTLVCTTPADNRNLDESKQRWHNK